MKAEERKHLEENSLVAWLQDLAVRARSGRLVAFRWLGLILAAVLVVGVWWYAVYRGRQADSQVWSGLADVFRNGGRTALDDFAAAHRETTAGRLARLENARTLLGPEGIARLQAPDRDQRDRGVENIQKAREELARLADEFQNSPTLRATSLMAAAEAELALVGVPRPDGTGRLGTVQMAADLYRQAAQAIGEATPAGEEARKRAEELEAKREEVERVSVRLYELVTPPPAVTLPGDPHPDSPKPPEGPITDPKAPEGVGPKAPDAPLTPADPPPAGVIPPPPPTAPTPPPPPEPKLPPPAVSPSLEPGKKDPDKK
jgi:hypothetical protein